MPITLPGLPPYCGGRVCVFQWSYELSCLGSFFFLPLVGSAMASWSNWQGGQSVAQKPPSVDWFKWSSASLAWIWAFNWVSPLLEPFEQNLVPHRLLINGIWPSSLLGRISFLLNLKTVQLACAPLLVVLLSHSWSNHWSFVVAVTRLGV